MIFLVMYSAFQSLDLALRGKFPDAITLLTDLLTGSKWARVFAQMRKECGVLIYDFDTKKDSKKERQHHFFSMKSTKRVKNVDIPHDEKAVFNRIITEYITGVICARAAEFSYLHWKLTSDQNGSTNMENSRDGREKGNERDAPGNRKIYPDGSTRTLYPNNTVVEKCILQAQKLLRDVPLELRQLEQVTSGQ
ncbi:hypothetical protein BC829DRAFT_384699 [Chytridium lagenaria]|nr:hypothetical protein BC829DRAFT_384699 [Chytridium lagenaria]